MKQYLKEALTLADGDFADIRYEKVKSTTVQYQKMELKDYSSSVIEGGQTRALKNGGIAYRSFTDLAKAGGAVRGACRSASVMGKHSKAKEGLAKAPKVVEDVKA
ncbi:MAG: PmbA/TldA family metallopeptidase, partial [Planctomycetota bacterium]